MDTGAIRGELQQLLSSRLTSRRGYEVKDNSPYAECADGLRMSIQASSGHYCTPRTNVGPYNAVEIGFPNREVPELMPYAEDKDRPTDTVYGYVPIEVVADVIEKHGGFKAEGRQ